MVPKLQLLRAEHAPAVLEFELANRSYFAASIPDRGDEYFEKFAQRHEALLEQQDDGVGAFYLLIDEAGQVLGRFNLVFDEDGAAELGYRVAQRAAGRGVATAAVREVCRLAASLHGVRALRAAAATENPASQKVLAKAGFLATGPADPASLSGQPGTSYLLELDHAGRLGPGQEEYTSHDPRCS
ncbi:GNAT family N-acetyltransferase [Paeniglutamicibacter sp. ORCA_105]|jgi:ribosomal-protein-alanine N-acetyltransferase|uniref:GNAT family N-acetyltransferase n=1 Tax=Paeniglutamicibacter sp. ORCA_105 TaxID=3377336 RepID=UPI00389693AB